MLQQGVMQRPLRPLRCPAGARAWLSAQWVGGLAVLVPLSCPWQHSSQLHCVQQCLIAMLVRLERRGELSSQLELDIIDGVQDLGISWGGGTHLGKFLGATTGVMSDSLSPCPQENSTRASQSSSLTVAPPPPLPPSLVHMCMQSCCCTLAVLAGRQAAPEISCLEQCPGSCWAHALWCCDGWVERSTGARRCRTRLYTCVLLCPLPSTACPTFLF